MLIARGLIKALIEYALTLVGGVVVVDGREVHIQS